MTPLQSKSVERALQKTAQLRTLTMSLKLAKERTEMKECVFLLGAGASADAGIPTVEGMTKELRKLLPQLQDINGNVRPEYGEVFDLLAAYDPSIADNYERFFECIELLKDVQTDPLGKIVEVKISAKLRDAIFHLPDVLAEAVVKILSSRKVQPDYLAKLADFIPTQGRLKVFSLNYDCCLEDACEQAGIDLSTGFDPVEHTWKPSVFDRPARGINIYKLHGSLRWFKVTDRRQRSVPPYILSTTMEWKPGQSVPWNLKVPWKNPELVLGPGNKLQPDDPFITLLSQFHRSIMHSKVCVVIGYGHGDPHINAMLDRAFDSGIQLLDVNPSQHVNGRYIAEPGYSRLALKAKDALTNGHLASKLTKSFMSN